MTIEERRAQKVADMLLLEHRALEAGGQHALVGSDQRRLRRLQWWWWRMPEGHKAYVTFELDAEERALDGEL